MVSILQIGQIGGELSQLIHDRNDLVLYTLY